MSYEETDELNSFFDIGDVEGYEPPKDEGYPSLEASRTVWQMIDGKRVAKHDPIYLFKIAGQFVPGVDRYKSGPALVGRALSVHPAKTGARRRVSVPHEIPKFISKDRVRELVLADDTVGELEKEERIKVKIGTGERAKELGMQLAQALLGSEDVRALNAFLQTTDADGAAFGAAVSVRRWCNVCRKAERGKAGRVCECEEKNWNVNNDFLKFYPASEATERMPE
jgi:hypothetical protein